MNARMKRPGPAFVVALVALFFALGGTAGAVVTAAVPLAKRRSWRTTQRRSAVSRQSRWRSGSPPQARARASLAADAEGEFTVACDGGQKVLGGGFTSTGSVFSFDSYPASDTAWRLYLANASASAGASVTLYATCLR
jgi:hypothetical protein